MMLWRFLFLAIAPLLLAGASTQRVQVTADRGEAEAVLALLDTIASGAEPDAAAWQRLFDTQGYRRLKQREASLKRDFTDADFKAFLASPEARAKAAGWHAAYARWSDGLVKEAAAKAFAYLPKNAVLRATIYPTIKPKPNQFVFDLRGDPAIFLYLDPTVSTAEAANTMAHELHHIGLGSVCLDPPPSAVPGVAKLRDWIGGFGEGLAMLAAAGGPNVHPHAASPAGDRARWDADVARVAEQLAEQNAFFLRVLDGQAGDDAAIDGKMRQYYGTTQGPWYTVGWRMAQVIEQQLGRPRVIDAFCRPATLLATYNQAAARAEKRGGLHLPRWDVRLAARLAEGVAMP